MQKRDTFNIHGDQAVLEIRENSSRLIVEIVS